MRSNGLQEDRFRVVAQTVEMRGVLEFRDQTEGLSGSRSLCSDNLNDFLKGRDFEAVVVAGVMDAQGGQTLTGTQGLEFCESEIRGEPAGLLLAVNGDGLFPIGKFRMV